MKITQLLSVMTVVSLSSIVQADGGTVSSTDALRKVLDSPSLSSTESTLIAGGYHLARAGIVWEATSSSFEVELTYGPAQIPPHGIDANYIIESTTKVQISQAGVAFLADPTFSPVLCTK